MRQTRYRLQGAERLDRVRTAGGSIPVEFDEFLKGLAAQDCAARGARLVLRHGVRGRYEGIHQGAVQAGSQNNSHRDVQQLISDPVDPERRLRGGDDVPA